MPHLAGLIEETEDELCIEEGTANIADDDTFDTEMSTPLSVFLNTTLDGTGNFVNASDITGQTVTVNLLDETGTTVGAAIDVRYLAIGHK